MSAIPARKAKGGVGDPMGALDMLALAKWITEPQYDAGLMFGELFRDDRQTYYALRQEIGADLVKIDGLDLATRVCRDHALQLAYDRMPDLRRALDLIALRFKQIERLLKIEIRTSAPTAECCRDRKVSPDVVADTST